MNIRATAACRYCGKEVELDCGDRFPVVRDFAENGLIAAERFDAELREVNYNNYVAGQKHWICRQCKDLYERLQKAVPETMAGFRGNAETSDVLMKALARCIEENHALRARLQEAEAVSS